MPNYLFDNFSPERTPTHSNCRQNPRFGVGRRGPPRFFFRFPRFLPIYSDSRSLFSGTPGFVPICSVFCRFVPICFQNKIRFRTNQGDPLLPTLLQIARIITELIHCEPEVCICNGHVFRIQGRICICNERFSANIPTDLSLQYRDYFFWPAQFSVSACPAPDLRPGASEFVRGLAWGFFLKPQPPQTRQQYEQKYGPQTAESALF